MNKKYFGILLIIAVFTLSACSVFSSGSSSGLPQTLTHEWTIETGDVDELFVAEDGKIYGLVYSKLPRRHITFTPDGELADVVELPYDERIPDGFYGSKESFFALPDGTIIINLDWNTVFINPDHSLAILPDPDSVPDKTIYRKEISQNGDAWAYCFMIIHDNSIDVSSNGGVEFGEDSRFYVIYDIDKNKGFIEKKRITLPDISDYSVYADRDEISSLVYENTLQENIVFYNRKGELVYDSLPDGLDFSRRYFYYLTPWGDLWLDYHLYDVLGVDQGQAILLKSL